MCGAARPLAPLGRSVCLSDAPCAPSLAGDASLAASRLAPRASDLEQRRYTPLMRACANGHADVLKLLLAAGADTSLKNKVRARVRRRRRSPSSLTWPSRSPLPSPIHPYPHPHPSFPNLTLGLTQTLGST